MNENRLVATDIVNLLKKNINYLLNIDAILKYYKFKKFLEP